jgi:glycosyltransferase involved in cell wall biosynthesis
VHLLGSRKDIDAILPAFDLFALVSDTEGLSNAILEAQACGLPVVATAVGGNPDLVDEACGILVAARDPEAQGKAIAALLNDPARRERMGTAARNRVVRAYSLDAMMQAYAALYLEHAHVR